MPTKAEIIGALVEDFQQNPETILKQMTMAEVTAAINGAFDSNYSISGVTQTFEKAGHPPGPAYADKQTVFRK